MKKIRFIFLGLLLISSFAFATNAFSADKMHFQILYGSTIGQIEVTITSPGQGMTTIKNYGSGPASALIDLNGDPDMVNVAMNIQVSNCGPGTHTIHISPVKTITFTGSSKQYFYVGQVPVSSSTGHIYIYVQ